MLSFAEFAVLLIFGCFCLLLLFVMLADLALELGLPILLCSLIANFGLGDVVCF